MTSRGFETQAAATAARAPGTARGRPAGASAIDAIERGIARRSRRVVSPSWVRPLLPFRELVQRVVEVALGRRRGRAVAIAQEETGVELTTPQP